MTKKNGKTQVTLTTCILCNKPFSSGYLKKRMNETRQFLDWLIFYFNTYAYLYGISRGRR